MADFQELAARLRRLADGRIEWRVQHPVEKSYCVSFDSNQTLFPEYRAREWLAKFQSKFPDHPHAKYEVAHVRVFTELEQAALDAAEAMASHGTQPCGAMCRDELRDGLSCHESANGGCARVIANAEGLKP